MISALYIGNFKAFGATQRIPIKPITLLFGANSAGKSSVGHALILMRAALRGRNLDAQRLGSEGDLSGSLDLGGFWQYVYKHDLHKAIVWGADIPIADLDLPGSVAECLQGETTLTLLTEIRKLSVQAPSFQLSVQPAPGHEDEARALGSKLTAFMRGRNWQQWPYITSYELRSDSGTILTLAIGEHPHSPWELGGGRYLPLSELSQVHPFFLRAIARAEEDPAFRGVRSRARLRKSVLQHLLRAAHAGMDDGPLPTGLELSKDEGEAKTKDASEGLTADSLAGFPASAVATLFAQVYFAASTLIGSCSRHIERTLNHMTHVGALRPHPLRHQVFSIHDSSTHDQPGGWAWNALRVRPDVREAVNAWLGSKDRMQTPYRFDVKSIDNDTRQLVLVDRRSGATVSPLDVGAGISQVVPVLAAACTESHLNIIEQPELHLHPALQAELADVFLQAMVHGEERDQPTSFVLETHSEHLILRILRRIRETAAGRPPVFGDDMFCTTWSADGKRMTGQSKLTVPVTPDDVSVVYLAPGDTGAVATPIEVTERGEFATRWPDGFFPERAREWFS